jgi:UDP-N-acetylmuramate dehydrogenase
MKIRENVSLKDYTTFRIGGKARYFTDVQSEAELKEAVMFSSREKIPVFILGGGSNTLVSDGGFSGLVIRIGIQGISSEDRGGKVKVRVGAGEDWDQFVSRMVSKGLFGVENLSYIPGIVGAAPIQNIGAYGSEVKDTIEAVEVFDTEILEMKTLTNSKCGFGYRTSIFKTEIGRKWIVTSVIFKLSKKGIPNISYKDVALYFTQNRKGLTLSSIRDAVIAVRKGKLPDVKNIGTAGSFFKNPIITRDKYEELKATFGEIPGVLISGVSVKVPAGWLLDHIGGFRDVRRGDAGVWNRQALVIVNLGKATSKNILSLASVMREKIKKETGITLEPEVVIV